MWQHPEASSQTGGTRGRRGEAAPGLRPGTATSGAPVATPMPPRPSPSVPASQLLLTNPYSGRLRIALDPALVFAGLVSAGDERERGKPS